MRFFVLSIFDGVIMDGHPIFSVVDAGILSFILKMEIDVTCHPIQGCHYAGPCQLTITNAQLYNQPALKGNLGLADRHENTKLTFLFSKRLQNFDSAF